MNRRTGYRLGIAVAVAASTACGAAAVSAGDCFRLMGIGYSAGYHAPAPLAQSATCAKLPGWHGWKGACCHPGTPAAGCGCGAIAPPCATCLPPTPCCGPACGAAPCCGPGLFGLFNHCGVRNPGVY